MDNDFYGVLSHRVQVPPCIRLLVLQMESLTHEPNSLPGHTSSQGSVSMRSWSREACTSSTLRKPTPRVTDEQHCVRCALRFHSANTALSCLRLEDLRCLPHLWEGPFWTPRTEVLHPLQETSSLPRTVDSHPENRAALLRAHRPAVHA